MVKKLIKFMGREVSDIHDAAYVLAIFTFLAQLVALVRDRLLASHFGASETLDIYYASFRIPDLIFVSLASFVSVSVMIPFIQEKVLKGEKESKDFISNVFTCFFGAVLFTAALAFVFMPKLIAYAYSGFSLTAQGEVVMLSRILLLSPILMGISNLFASVTQAFRRFAVYALCPFVYNLATVFGILVLYPKYGLSGIVYGVLIGAFLHTALQVPFVKSLGLFPRIKFHISWTEIKRIISISISRTLALSILNLAVFALLSFASHMAAGSIAIFNLAFNLESVPMSLIGISYSMAAFPLLSELFINGKKEKFIEEIASAMRHVIFLSIPIVMLFIVLRAQIVRVALGAGNFSWHDTRLTAACLAIFSIAAVAQSISLLFVRGYYAAGNSKRPLLVNVISTVCIVLLPLLFLFIMKTTPIFNEFLEQVLRIEGVSGSEVLSLPLGFTLGSILNAIIFFFFFKKDFGELFPKVGRTLFQSVSSAIIGGAGTYVFLNIFDSIFNLDTLKGIFAQGLLSGIGGLLVSLFVLKLMQSKELVEVTEILRRKISKPVVVVPEQTDL